MQHGEVPSAIVNEWNVDTSWKVLVNFLKVFDQLCLLLVWSGVHEGEFMRYVRQALDEAWSRHETLKLCLPQGIFYLINLSN